MPFKCSIAPRDAPLDASSALLLPACYPRKKEKQRERREHLNAAPHETRGTGTTRAPLSRVDRSLLGVIVRLERCGARRCSSHHLSAVPPRRHRDRDAKRHRLVGPRFLRIARRMARRRTKPETARIARARSRSRGAITPTRRGRTTRTRSAPTRASVIASRER